MRIFLSLTRSFRRLPISQKFYILIAVTILILLFELASFWFAMSTMSAIRAYVGGEGLWSKAQKESVNSLIRYSASFDESDYENSLVLLNIPMGDKQARIELQKLEPELAVAQQGFLEGGNNLADVPGLIFLFQKFQRVSYMQQAIAIWTEGDAEIQKQIAVAEKIHTVIVTRDNRTQSATALALKPLIQEVVIVDSRLTALESRFSATLGEASRSIGLLLLEAISLLTVFLGIMALLVALFISKIVSQIDAAKSEFVALVSHQLRTPLTVIKLSTEILKKSDISELTSEEQKAFDNIFYEVKRMASLIDTILDISRIELGTLVIDAEPMDVIAATRDIVAESVLAAGAKDIVMHQHYDPESLVIPLDRSLFEIILQNLLSNAVKYTPQGGTVSVSVTLQSSKIIICVSDTGYGIPKIEQRNIFTKLFRASNAGVIDPGGTGIGLYIVKSIVREAGGAISFESTEGKGTSFSVTFPMKGMQRHGGNVRLSK